ncbi:DUF981 family protein [Dietzia aurantiaca]|uniref:DUF981 family protein n=1 Tax=Dietzia aurantiaca TaxID=983873 RepID=A0ABV9PSM6_9ACTN
METQDSIGDFFRGVETPGMIDWTTMPTYNTVMALAVGAALVGLVLFFRALHADPAEVSVTGWSLNFGVLGLILTVTGLHMTLTWPFAAGGFAFDNIIFGEPSLALGVLLLAAAVYLWSKREVGVTVREVARDSRPMTIFVVGLGLALFAIALAGVVYQLFAAPPQEPISGFFGEWAIIEAFFISALYTAIGVGALLTPFATGRLARGLDGGVVTSIIGWCWAVTGAIWLLFAALNFYSHIGLVVNTM